MLILGIVGIIEIIYGLLVVLNIITPYSIKVSKNKKDHNWNKYHGATRICWGFAFVFFALWGLQIGYSILNIALGVAGVILALIASFKIKS